MSLSERRTCIFCGQVPDQKTREHVVPAWLIEMTGDPSRVVTFGLNFKKNQEPIRYSWSSFVAPACDKCNGEYSALEEKIKPIVEALQRREVIKAKDYILLLDWLDKVRVGIWLLRHLIENHPIEITPNFNINSRISAKDRMLAVYAFDGDGKGINLFGADSLIFNSMPSCFGLRINNILLLNASTDFFCSRGCGLPHPRSMSLIFGGENDGKMKLDNFVYENEVSHPITELNLHKPVVWLYQPIKQPSQDPIFKAGFYGHVNFFDSRLHQRTMDGANNQGALFRQFKDKVEILRDPEIELEFDEVIGEETSSAGQIVSTIYDVQKILFESYGEIFTDDGRPNEFDAEYRKLKISHSDELKDYYLKQ